VLSIDGRRIGDSTAIIAALEERNPEPPLYPADVAQRRRALELEEFFDDLVGESFSVADLSAASLFYPLALPDEAPLQADSPSAKGFEAFREPLVERRGLQWVTEMFRRHRKPAQARAAAPGAQPPIGARGLAP
jgi:glutathione S-transferase